MESEVLEEFYQNCLNSEELYFDYAELIFEALSVDPINVSNFLCEKSINMLSSDQKDISKYISLLFIRDAILQNELQSQFTIFNSEILNFVFEALSLLEDKKYLSNLEPIIQDEQINIKFFKIMILIFCEAKQFLKQGQIQQFDIQYETLIRKKVLLDMGQDFDIYNKEQFKKTNQVQIEEKKQQQTNNIQSLQDEDQEQDAYNMLLQTINECEKQDELNMNKLKKAIDQYRDFIEKDIQIQDDEKEFKLKQAEDINFFYNLLLEDHINTQDFRREANNVMQKNYEIQGENDNLEEDEIEDNLKIQTPKQQSSLEELAEYFETKISKIQDNSVSKKSLQPEKQQVSQPISLNFCNYIEQLKDEQSKINKPKNNFQVFKPQSKKIKNTQSNITLNYKPKVKKFVPMKVVDQSKVIQNQKSADQQNVILQNQKHLKEQIEKQNRDISFKDQEIQKLQQQNKLLQQQLQTYQNQNLSINIRSDIEEKTNKINIQLKNLEEEKNQLVQQNQQLNEKLQIKQEITRKQQHDKKSIYKIFKQEIPQINVKKDQYLQNDLQIMQQFMQQNKKAQLQKQIDWSQFTKNKPCLIIQMEEMEVYIRSLKRFENHEQPHIKFGIVFKNTSGDSIHNIQFSFGQLSSDQYDIMVNKKNFSSTLNCFQQTYLTVILYNKIFLDKLPQFQIYYDVLDNGQLVNKMEKTRLYFPFNKYLDFEEVDQNILNYNTIEQNFQTFKINIKEESLKNLQDLIDVLPKAQIQRQMINTIFVKFNLYTDKIQKFSCYFTLNTYQNQMKVGIQKQDKIRRIIS